MAFLFRAWICWVFLPCQGSTSWFGFFSLWTMNPCISPGHSYAGTCLLRIDSVTALPFQHAKFCGWVQFLRNRAEPNRAQPNRRNTQNGYLVPGISQVQFKVLHGSTPRCFRSSTSHGSVRFGSMIDINRHKTRTVALGDEPFKASFEHLKPSLEHLSCVTMLR